ncbi:uncharacterized protein C8orf34 homolog isoform X2 [Latimeria chalumnae]|uniref:uncharacterized protein C8orf34 homolog isoform X2 n=1 Tax=Latimeria chalumnae TaxID=7897 RepID=UPI0003C1AFA5|nr:PREDICTED: uncharacterized protein C8orf34 homolog [Latimeria chalumnae]|eukprot:XP_005995932.1 PREDICTED: uncharacterized protein C8orf34 homolog [Latimeria chalumnae]
MASLQQTRIQTYLEMNKIGPLFEEMMTKLITETPDQPIPFLISHLQTKQSSLNQLQRTLSGSAALWAETGNAETKGTRRDLRNYDKPWQINAKKPKKSKSDLAVSNISPPSPESKSLPRSIEHPPWDWRTKPESQDFDELNHILQESKKLGKALENLSRSITASDELDQDPRTFNSSLMRPCVIGEWVGREENDADPLAAEMLQPPVPRNKNEQWESEESYGSPAGSLKMETKSKGLKQQQQQHKKLLAAMLSQDSFDSVHSAAASLTEDDIDDEDDAMELLEDLDDLRMEGVTSLAPSGSKFSQGRSAYTAEPQAKVTLNICSRCARLQGGSLIEGTEEGPLLSHSPEQAVPETASPLPAVETLMEDDEEFESASQVTGPRRPVWDSDVLSARSGSSLNQKHLKESLSSKELHSMEKHLADMEKDLSMKVESKLSRSPNSPHNSLLIPTHQGTLQTLPIQNSRSQTPASQAGKSIQLQLLGSKVSPVANTRVQTPSNPSSRPQTPNTQTSRPKTPSAQGSRPATPNSLLSRPSASSIHENKEENIATQRSRPVTPSSQVGKPLYKASGVSAQVTEETAGTSTQRSTLSEDESYQQLQVARLPWTLPNDTDSEGVEMDQDKSSQTGAWDANKRSVFSGL